MLSWSRIAKPTAEKKQIYQKCSKKYNVNSERECNMQNVNLIAINIFIKFV